MGSKPRAAKKQPSPSPVASSSSSSEASSSRSPMALEEMSRSDSTSDQASNTGSDLEGDGDIVNKRGSDIEEDSQDDSAARRPKIDAAKAKTKLHHVSKTIRATAKKTKTFEVQKLVKKLKGLQNKPSPADQAELAEKELESLKSIDINLLAGRALITKMVKAKLLPRPAELEAADETEYLYLRMVKDEDLLGEDVLRDTVLVDGDKALEKAKAKITSSKVLADEVGKFVDELKKLVGIEPVIHKKSEVENDAKGKGKAKLQEVEDDDDEEDDEERQWSGSEDESDSDDEMPRHLALVDNNEDEDIDEADEEELMRIGKEKLKALGDLSQWDDMIGSDSAAESDSDDEPPTKQRRKYKHDSEGSSEESSSVGSSDSSADSDEEEDYSSGSDSGSDSDSEDSSSSISERPRKRKASPRASKPSKKSRSSSSSTFLPSLATGFIAGRSDDEWSDAEADLADRDLSEIKSGGKKERKNRMGQRARKALYEKKYGKNANHIKMREKQKAARLERAPRPQAQTTQGGRQRPPAFQAPAKRDGGWGGPVAPLPKQPKRPFVPRTQPGPPSAAQSQAPQAIPYGANKSGAPAAAPRLQEMHPSWIAKQKQKELMAQVKPQGKKVVFD